jgi:uncharacterized protein YndB with AHSA1/START domain
MAVRPDAVYRVISVLTLIPKWSPECDRVDLVTPAAEVTVGTRFVGHNHDAYMQWSTTCEVETAVPGVELSFRTVKGVFLARTRWKYLLAPEREGTQVTESYEVIRANPWPIRKLTMRKRHDSDAERPKKLVANIETSLRNLEVYLLSSQATGGQATGSFGGGPGAAGGDQAWAGG